MHDAIPTTPAIRALRAAKAEFTAHSYKYEERGGTAQAARELGIDEHRIVKTIVLRNGAGRPLIMLMHGDREISTKNLARALGEKTVELCERAEAERHSGYHCGGTSPFGFRRPGVPFIACSQDFPFRRLITARQDKGIPRRLRAAQQLILFCRSQKA